MKKVFASLLLFVAVSTAVNAQTAVAPLPTGVAAPAQPNPNAAKIIFKEETFDFKELSEGPQATHEFKFTNTGSEDLIIASCSGSCGCTVPECPKEVYGPGESGVIKVKYATDRVGQFTKNVTVNSNATNGTITLTIKGNVLPDAQ